MYNGVDVEKAIKIYSYTDFSKESVVIDEKTIKLNGNSYTKRTKIYNKHNIWINTKPLYLDKISIDTENVKKDL